VIKLKLQPTPKLLLQDCPFLASLDANCRRDLTGDSSVDSMDNGLAPYRDWQDSAVTIRAAEEDSGSMLLRAKVSIVGSEPGIWRLLEIDPSLTLDRIHDILQTAVGWRDSHLHSFTDTDPYVRLCAINGVVREPRRWVPPDLLEDNDGAFPETDWTLGQILTAEPGPLFYEYDFGDG
jgi:hypothetical protein